MSLTEWIQQFFKDHFSAPAERATKPTKLVDNWDHYNDEEKEQLFRDRIGLGTETFLEVTDGGFYTRPSHELLPVTWPNGAPWDPLKPFYDEGTEKTYETLEDMVEDVGRPPRSLSFGAARFDR